MSKNKQKKRDLERLDRYHFIELYPDNEEHINAIDYIINHFEYVGILHDKDVKINEENDMEEYKKKHYHFVVHFVNARTRSAISKELNIDKRFIEPIDKKEKAFRYLLHLDNTDKTKYNKSELFGNMLDYALKFCVDKIDLNTLFLSFVDWLDSQNCYVRYTDCQKWFANQNALGYLRNISFWNYAVDEHNEIFKNR